MKSSKELTFMKDTKYFLYTDFTNAVAPPPLPFFLHLARNLRSKKT